jgi:hypothetical protein
MSFLTATQGALQRHGLDLVYNSVTTGTYDVESGSTTNTSVSYTLRMYPKQIVANTYNHPELIGKESLMFYLANAPLAFTPRTNDEITYKGNVYRVQSYQEHVASGTVVLYRIIAVKG